MNRVRFYCPAALLRGALFVSVSSFPGPVFAEDKGKGKVAPPVVKWEYKVIKAQDDPAMMEDALNKLGEEGWECVGTVSRVFGGGGGGRDRGASPLQSGAHLICKRPKQ